MRGSGTIGRAYRTLPTFAALALILCAPASAQMVEDASPARKVAISAAFGVLTPLSNLTSDPGSFGTVLTPSLVLGAEAALWLTDNVGIAAFGTWAPSELDSFGTQFQGAIPDSLGDATFVSGTANLLLRVRGSGSASVIEPYVALGGGVRHLSVEDIASPQVESNTGAVVTAALGARVGLGSGIWMRAEVRDFASRYESPATGDSRTQHAMMITLGIGRRFP